MLTSAIKKILPSKIKLGEVLSSLTKLQDQLNGFIDQTEEEITTISSKVVELEAEKVGKTAEQDKAVRVLGNINNILK